NSRIGPEGIDARQRSIPRRIEVPTHPVRSPFTVVIGQRVSGFLHQVVERLEGVGAAWIAHSQVNTRWIWRGLTCANHGVDNRNRALFAKLETSIWRHGVGL